MARKASSKPESSNSTATLGFDTDSHSFGNRHSVFVISSAWVQHFIHHLANGSMSSNQSGEGNLRRALHGQLFYSTQIHVCLWFIAKGKKSTHGLQPVKGSGDGLKPRTTLRDRRRETLFIDARKMDTLIDRVHRELTAADLEKIVSTYHAWRGDSSFVVHASACSSPPADTLKREQRAYQDLPGFCKSASTTEIAAHLEETALGHTPKGWEVRSLDKTAHYLNGLALQKYPPGDGATLPDIKIAQLRKGDSVGVDRCNTDLPSNYIVQDGDVLFSWSGSLEVELWCGGPSALNQHLFKVTSPEFPKWFYYLWTLYHLDEFRLIAADKATTMGHIQRGHLTAAKVLIPPRPLLDAMTRTKTPLIDQFIANRIQSRTLATLRDTLLPKLLSGADQESTDF